MEPCCLVCRSSEVDELISVSCVTSTGRKTIREMIDIFVNIRACQILLGNDNSVDQKSCRLPEQLCDQCLSRLDRAYRIWKDSRSVGSIKKCEPGAEELYRVCRICAKGDPLVSMFCLCQNRKIKIALMVEYLVNVRVKPGDQLPPYICMDCLKDLNEGYGFKKDALESIKFFREQSLHPWQKMQLRVDCSKRLVVELSSEGVLDTVQRVVTCSVCSLKFRFGKLKRTCRGCRLEFRNYDEIARQIEVERMVEEVDVMDNFVGITDYDEVLDDEIGDLMNNEMLVEVEKLPVHEKNDSLKKKENKPRELNHMSILPNRKNDKESTKKMEKNSRLISILTIIEYKCCFEGCSQYGAVEDLEKHFQQNHPPIEPQTPPSPFKCPICGYSFPDKNSLKSHCGEPCPLYKCSGSACSFATRSHDCAMRHLERDKDDRNMRHGCPKPIDIKHLGKYFIIDEPLDENSFTLTRLYERCCWCGELFMELHELEAHRDFMHAVVKAPFQCETCNKSFESLLALSRHRSRASLRTHYYCQLCEKTFWEMNTFKLHKYTEHVTATVAANGDDKHLYASAITCCGCEDTFEAIDQLEKHRREVHLQQVETIDQKLCCESCGKAFPTSKKMQTHKRKYQSGKLFSCLVLECVFKTTNLAQIKNHVTSALHINAEGKTMTIRRLNPSIYFCCISRCQFKSSSYDEIVKHAASTHEANREQNSAIYSDDPAAFRCKACFKNCRSELGFINHRNSRPSRKCKHCNKSVPRAEHEAHEANCSKRNEFVCEICKEKILGRFRYKIHMNSEHAVHIPHLKEKPKDEITPRVICTVCGLLVRKHYLVSHMQSKHEQKRVFKCDECDARFKLFNTMKIHKTNVHSTVKLYPCRQGCDKRYKHAGDRQRHEKLVHLGITPFVCAVCSESFVRERDLRLHERKHTGRKLYVCDHCGADYDRLVDFKEHQKACGSTGLVAE